MIPLVLAPSFPNDWSSLQNGRLDVWPEIQCHVQSRCLFCFIIRVYIGIFLILPRFTFFWSPSTSTSDDRRTLKISKWFDWETMFHYAIYSGGLIPYIDVLLSLIVYVIPRLSFSFFDLTKSLSHLRNGFYDFSPLIGAPPYSLKKFTNRRLSSFCLLARLARSCLSIFPELSWFYSTLKNDITSR